MEQKFFICKHCNKIVGIVKDSKVPMMCCGEKMEELIPGTVEASKEKHIPVIEISGNQVTVKVGEVSHPMEDAHFIEWISLRTKEGNQRKALKAGDKPEAKFAIVEGDEVLGAYAYCNLHGLWKAEK